MTSIYPNEIGGNIKTDNKNMYSGSKIFLSVKFYLYIGGSTRRGTGIWTLIGPVVRDMLACMQHAPVVCGG